MDKIIEKIKSFLKIDKVNGITWTVLIMAGVMELFIAGNIAGKIAGGVILAASVLALITDKIEK